MNPHTTTLTNTHTRTLTHLHIVEVYLNITQAQTKQQIHGYQQINSFQASSNQNQFLESDNPGSTDSEILRILTLHIPITEYDTLGSESDNDVTSRNVNQAKYRQRGE